MYLVVCPHCPNLLLTSGCWNSANKKYLYGIRNNMHIIDIASTEQHLWRALNVTSLIAYSGGSILFVNNRPGYQYIVQVYCYLHMETCCVYGMMV